MKIIKMAALTTVTALALVAFAAPGVASAAHWTKEGSTLEGSGGKEIALSGTLMGEWAGNGNGIECDVSATLSTFTERVTKFQVLPQDCKGFGLYFDTCEVQKATVKNLPWHVQVKGENLAIEGLAIEYTVAWCPIDTINAIEVVYPEIDAAVTEEKGHSAAVLSSSSGTMNIWANEGSESFELEGAANGVLNAATEGLLHVPDTVDIEGSLDSSLSGTGSGFHCALHGQAMLFPGDEGEVTELEIDPEQCEGYGAVMEGCNATAATAGLPWSMRVVGSEVMIEDISYSVDFAECPFNNWQAEGGELAAIPDSATAISSLEAVGSTSYVVGGQAWGGPTALYLGVSPAGMYGIG